MTGSPITVTAGASLSECAQILHRERIRHLPVVTEKGALFGLLTDFDVFLRGQMVDDEAFRPYDPSATWLQAHHLCRRVDVTVGPDDALLDGLLRLLGTRQDIVVVIEHDRVVGVLCEHDVVGIAAAMDCEMSWPLRPQGYRLLTVDRDDPAIRARHMMANERIRHLIVLDQGQLHSVLSFRDVAIEGTLSESQGAGFVGPRHAEFGQPGIPVCEAARRMSVGKIGCLPLVNSQGVPIDIVTRTDVIRAVVRVLESAVPGERYDWGRTDEP